jgi:hypothetical protein
VVTLIRQQSLGLDGQDGASDGQQQLLSNTSHDEFAHCTALSQSNDEHGDSQGVDHFVDLLDGGFAAYKLLELSVEPAIGQNRLDALLVLNVSKRRTFFATGGAGVDDQQAFLLDFGQFNALVQGQLALRGVACTQPVWSCNFSLSFDVGEMGLTAHARFIRLASEDSGQSHRPLIQSTNLTGKFSKTIAENPVLPAGKRVI